MMRVVKMAVHMFLRLVHVLVLMTSVICHHTPHPISEAANQNAYEVGSRRKSGAAAAPMKGAVEKHAPVRAYLAPAERSSAAAQDAGRTRQYRR